MGHDIGNVSTVVQEHDVGNVSTRWDADLFQIVLLNTTPKQNKLWEISQYHMCKIFC
jgi:hypothetical protein